MSCLGWWFAEPIASFFIDDTAESTTALTLGALSLLPLGVLAIAPFMALRPIFEAVQRPRLGVYLALARYTLCALPLVLLGRFLAPLLGFEPLHGLIVGLAIGTGLASLTTCALAARVLSDD